LIATGGQILPGDHPERMALNNEVHARPPEALQARMRISYVVLFGELDMGPLRALCGKYGVEPPGEAANHFSADLGPFRLKWERHTEFTRYWFLVPAAGANALFERTALEAVPQGWLKTLKGDVLVATHVELMPVPGGKLDEEKLSRQHFAGNPLVGSSVAGGLGRAFTDFRIHADGFGRLLVQDNGMTPRQRGRMVQRLLEIDTYRVLALLTLPVARKLMPQLSAFEAVLGDVTSSMRTAGEADEPKLLDRLTLLNADVVREHTASQFRFSAAKAYSDLVSLRIAELREERICEAAAKRLDTVSERVARATQMLSTRVDISRERQNQSLLESMDKRAKLQLRLQETVEGLSIAAITYYIVGLIGYLAKGAKEAGLLPVSDLIVTAAAIPVVIVAVALAVRRVRKSIME
jgi:uncharacterized membrane-anchored protein